MPQQEKGVLLDRQAWLTCWIILCGVTSLSMLALHVPLLALDSGAGPAMVGAVISGGALLPVALALPAGMGVDRIGPKVIMLGSALALALSAAALAFDASIPTLFASQIGIGLGRLGLIVAAQTHISSVNTRGGAATALGWYSAFVSAGQFIGPVAAGVLHSADLVRIGLGACTLLAVVAAVLSRRVANTRSSSARQGGSGADFDHKAGMSGSEPFLAAIAASAGITMLASGYETFLPIYAVELGMGPAVAGIALSSRALTSMVVRPFLGVYTARVGSSARALVLAMLAASCGLLVLVFVAGPMWFVAASVPVGLGAGFAIPLSILLTAESVRHRGRALGTRLAANHGAMFATPLAFGGLATVAGFAPAFGICGLMGIGMALLARRMFGVHVTAPTTGGR